MDRSLLLGTALLLTLGCGDNGPNEAVGNLTVVTTTLGTPDPNGYTLAVTGQVTRDMAVNDTAYYVGLPIGDYTITLGDVAGGCSVTDGATHPRYIAIGSNTVRFQVVCP